MRMQLALLLSGLLSSSTLQEHIHTIRGRPPAWTRVFSIPSRCIEVVAVVNRTVSVASIAKLIQAQIEQILKRRRHSTNKRPNGGQSVDDVLCFPGRCLLLPRYDLC
uniref:Putative secreted protein n=1 Tax=Anopheles marajoara TaxID=58244 RepID=A0A2M4C888_9DIPT